MINLKQINKNIFIKIIKMLDNNKEDTEETMINSPDEESPKIEPINKNEVFIDIPIRTTSNENEVKGTASADLVSIQGSTGMVNEIIKTNDNDTVELIVVNDLDEKANKLIKLIKENKKKITNNLYIISCKYDNIYYIYNSISLSLLIISTIITFIEAIRLTIVNYDTQFKGSEISRYISQETISLIINCVSLSLSTILTILSSIARFKNYKENMDKLKIIHDTLFNYKNLYDKEKDLIIYYKINGGLTLEIFRKVEETINEYYKEIKNLNIFENIRNTDIIKFNKIKVNHDIKLQKLASTREIELLKLNKSTDKKKDELNNPDNIQGLDKCCYKVL